MKKKNREKGLICLLILLCMLMMGTFTTQAAATNLNMKKGAKKEVNVSLSYTQASHGVGLGYFVWTSTNPKVADVYGFSPKGTITAKGNGTCYIYANCYSPAPGAFGAWKVTVGESGSSSSSSSSTTSKKKVTVKSVKLSKTSLTLNTGKSKTLKYTVSPNNAKTTITWKSSNTSVASVSGGKVTAKNPGKTTITVTTANGKKKSCKVTVKAPAKKVKISNTSLKLGKGDKIQLTATPEPYNTTDKLKWSTSNKKIATVNAKGIVTAKKGGKVTITAQYGSKKAKCTVNIAKKGVKSILPVNSNITMNRGQAAVLNYKLTPSGSGGTFTWSSSNTGVAKVDQKGNVTGVAAGTATITVKASSGASARFNVNVVIPVTSVSVDRSSVQIEKGKSYSLAASLTPWDTTDKISWSSSDSSVAAVSANGTVTGVKVGTAYIYATAGSCTAKCTVTVKDEMENGNAGSGQNKDDSESTSLTKIQISGNTNSMLCGSSQTLDCYAYYGSEKIYVSCSKVSWTSSNAAVAEVSSSGKVTAKRQGRATITASYEGKTASFSLEVKMSDGVDISKGYIRIYNGYYEQWNDESEIRADYNPAEGLRIVQSSSETYDINIEADAKLILEGVEIYAIRCYEDNVNIVIEQEPGTVNRVLNGITMDETVNLTICGNGTLYTTTYGTALRGGRIHVQHGKVIAETTSENGWAIHAYGGLIIDDGAHVTHRWNIKEGYTPDAEEQALIDAGKLTWEYNR